MWIHADQSGMHANLYLNADQREKFAEQGSQTSGRLIASCVRTWLWQRVLTLEDVISILKDPKIEHVFEIPHKPKAYHCFLFKARSLSNGGEYNNVASAC